MKQRCAIARAYAMNPSILLMDEPFGALDALPGARAEHLLETWEQDRRTIVFITHDVDEAAFLANRVVVMAARPGRIHRIIDVDLPYPRTEDVRLARSSPRSATTSGPPSTTSDPAGTDADDTAPALTARPRRMRDEIPMDVTRGTLLGDPTSGTRPRRLGAELQLGDLTEVTYGYIPDFNGASLLDGETGLWEENGLKVTTQTFTNGPLQIQALGTGDLDFGYIGPGAMWLPASGKAKVVTVNGVGQADRVIAQPGIAAIEDLAGKKVAIPEGTSGDMIVQHSPWRAPG